MKDYQRIARAIEFIADNVTGQPELAEIAAHVHLSPYHFQRLFCRWAGISPKRFLQVMTLEKSKSLLDFKAALLDTADQTGLSSASRLHDHFVQLEAVTPGQYQTQGRGLMIRHATQDSPYGPLFIAQTDRGLCRLAFVENSSGEQERANLQADWPQAQLIEDKTSAAKTLKQLFSDDHQRLPFPAYVQGTNFQVAVWRALLRIPEGCLVSYSQLAQLSGYPGSARAVGNAVGANPLAWLIPCHRVIRQTGALGGYRWGDARKTLILVRESCRQGSDLA